MGQVVVEASGELRGRTVSLQPSKTAEHSEIIDRTPISGGALGGIFNPPSPLSFLGVGEAEKYDDIFQMK